MENLSSEYIKLLVDFKKAPIEDVLYHHQLFWINRVDDARKELNQNQFSAYHLGIIPSKINKSLEDNWYLDPQISMQRVGLYADVIVIDDILANILEKVLFVENEQNKIIAYQAEAAITTLIQLKKWIDFGIVRILPGKKYLKKIYNEEAITYLDAISREETFGDLPDQLKNLLSPEQLEKLSYSAGHSLNYKINKALLLKEQFDLVPSADDSFFDILGEKLKWNHKVLADTGNLFVIRKVRTKYLCNSPELVFELRKQNKLSDMRTFFREQLNSYFGEDIKSRSDQASIDEFSRMLIDQIHSAESELKNLKRKFGSDLIINLTMGSATMLFALGIDFATNYVSWIPKIIGAIPAASAGASILNAIRDYMEKRADIRTKPTFILGSQMEKK
jgi:hypothetical protein